MKIKIIDLLTKIANGEEVPKTIRWYDEFYNDYDEISNDYKVFVYEKLKNNVWDLNDEVEIIDDEEWRTIFDFPKRVSQFDKDGNLVGSFPSSYEAEKITGISRTHIGGCCRGERLTAGGYVWKFEIEESKKIEKIDEILRIDDLIPPYGENEYKAWENIIIQQNKINELIDKINNLKEND